MTHSFEDLYQPSDRADRTARYANLGAAPAVAGLAETSYLSPKAVATFNMPSPSASGAGVAKSAAPAAASWRETLMKERQSAEARGFKAPADALAAFEAEIGARLSALSVDESD